MSGFDLNDEWLGYLQPVGLVLSPAVLDRYDLLPAEQTRADREAVAACLTPEGSTTALADPWTFFDRILGWRDYQVGGRAGGGPAVAASRVAWHPGRDPAREDAVG